MNVNVLILFKGPDMLCTIPKFTVEYDKEKHRKNTTTETIFHLLNEMSENDNHLSKGRTIIQKFFEHLLDIMLPERAVDLITESIDCYLEARKEKWGMTQYETQFYTSYIAHHKVYEN